MTTSIQLTETQCLVLEHAANGPSGRITWFPPNVKGGARTKVVAGLHARGLVTNDSMFDCRLTDAAYSAIGRAIPSNNHIAEMDAALTISEAAFAPYPLYEVALTVAPPALPEAHTEPAVAAEASFAEAKPVRTRENSKQATVVAMLKRSEGATIQQIADATGWQCHTLRGALAGVLKKKLGLVITSAKAAGGPRTYSAAH